MELLLRTNFDIPKPPGGVFDPLRYLSLGSGQQSQQQQQHSHQQSQQSHQPHQPHPHHTSELVKTEQQPDTRTTSPTAVYEVARPILQGCHAIPTKLKILLDRALSALGQEEVLMIVSGCGWQLDDYQRGYKLKDASGCPLDRWNMCTKHEEPLILQQFLLFRETRTITQQIIIQDLAERSMGSMGGQGREADNLKVKEVETINKEREYKREPPVYGRRDSLLQMVTDGQRNHSEKDVTHLLPLKRESIVADSPPPAPKPTPPVVTSIAPNTPTKAPSPIFPRAGIPLPPSTMAMSSLINSSMSFPGMFPFGPHIQAQQAAQAAQAAQIASLSQSKDGPGKEFNGGQALNLTRPEKSHNLLENRGSEGHLEMDSDSGSRRSSMDADSKRHSNVPDDIGHSFVSPTTGKKRVQCNVCMKTFCDKGALKIHFSAVHLREMHKCSVSGCNMMFSSRRSRNRHSANPNPKLHTPQVKRRISQHDGRTHPGPLAPSIHSRDTSTEREQISLLPKERETSGFPGTQVPGGFPGPQGAPGIPPLGFPGLPGFNPFLPPDLKSLQQDLQRFSDLQKLYSGVGGQNSSSDSPSQQTIQSANSCQKYSDSECSSENQHGRSSDNIMGSDGGNRKRKSQNPTKRPHLEMEEVDEHISSDSASDEGFPDPMMEDDDDDLGDVSSGDEAV